MKPITMYFSQWQNIFCHLTSKLFSYHGHLCAHSPLNLSLLIEFCSISVKFCKRIPSFLFFKLFLHFFNFHYSFNLILLFFVYWSLLVFIINVLEVIIYLQILKGIVLTLGIHIFLVIIFQILQVEINFEWCWKSCQNVLFKVVWIYVNCTK